MTAHCARRHRAADHSGPAVERPQFAATCVARTGSHRGRRAARRSSMRCSTSASWAPTAAQPSGSGVGPRITMDGGTINDEMEGGTSMNFSQEIVQEFQISTAELRHIHRNRVRRAGSTSLRAPAATICTAAPTFFIAITTWPPIPVWHAIRLSPIRSFQRKNPGVCRRPHHQRQAVFLFQLRISESNRGAGRAGRSSVASGLSGIWPEPYHYNLFNVRFDYHVSTTSTACFCATRTMATRASAPTFGTPQPAEFQLQLQLVRPGDHRPHQRPYRQPS